MSACARRGWRIYRAPARKRRRPTPLDRHAGQNNASQRGAPSQHRLCKVWCFGWDSSQRSLKAVTAKQSGNGSRARGAQRTASTPGFAYMGVGCTVSELSFHYYYGRASRRTAARCLAPLGERQRTASMNARRGGRVRPRGEHIAQGCAAAVWHALLIHQEELCAVWHAFTALAPVVHRRRSVQQMKSSFKCSRTRRLHSLELY